jgi:hypothetical protein
MTSTNGQSLDDRIIENLKDIAAQIYLHLSFCLIIVSSKISEVADTLFKWGLINMPDLFWKILWVCARDKHSLKVITHPSIEYKLRWAFHCGIFTIGECPLINISYIKLIMANYQHPSSLTDSGDNKNIIDTTPNIHVSSSAITFPVTYIYKKHNVWHRLSISFKDHKYLKQGPPDDRLLITGWRVILFNRIEL